MINQHITWKKNGNKGHEKKSPRAAMRTPAAVNITERAT